MYFQTHSSPKVILSQTVTCSSRVCPNQFHSCRCCSLTSAGVEGLSSLGMPKPTGPFQRSDRSLPSRRLKASNSKVKVCCAAPGLAATNLQATENSGGIGLLESRLVGMSPMHLFLVWISSLNGHLSNLYIRIRMIRTFNRVFQKFVLPRVLTTVRSDYPAGHHKPRRWLPRAVDHAFWTVAWFCGSGDCLFFPLGGIPKPGEYVLNVSWLPGPANPRSGEDGTMPLLRCCAAPGRAKRGGGTVEGL